MKNNISLFPLLTSHQSITSQHFSKIYHKLHHVLFLLGLYKITSNVKANKYLANLPSTNIILSFAEALVLYKITQLIPLKSTIVEIGTWRGGSATVIASSLKEIRSLSRLHTIDPYNSERDRISNKYLKIHSKALNLVNPMDNLFYVKSILKKFGLNKYVKIHVCRSGELVKKWNKKIGLLFIDGNHTYQNVKSDILDWSKFVVRDGLIAVHDCTNFNNNILGLSGPTRAVRECLSKNIVNWEFIGQIDTLAIFKKL